MIDFPMTMLCTTLYFIVYRKSHYTAVVIRQHIVFGKPNVLLVLHAPCHTSVNEFLLVLISNCNSSKMFINAELSTLRGATEFTGVENAGVENARGNRRG